MHITKDEFTRLVEDYVLPLVPVAAVGEAYEDKTISVTTAEIITESNDHFLIVKSKDGLLYKSKLSCKVDKIKYITNALSEAQYILDGLNTISNERKKDFYLKEIFSYSFLDGICASLTKAGDGIYLMKVILLLQRIGERTYEGSRVPYGVIIDFENKNGVSDFDFCSFLKTKYSSTFTDGAFSAVIIDKNGFFVSHVDLSSKSDHTPRRGKQKESFVPSRFEAFSKYCKGNRIGVIYLSGGDILIIKKDALVFARREGHWYRYDYDLFSQCLNNYISLSDDSNNVKRYLSKSMYVSLLDTSFAHTGACIAVTNYTTKGNKVTTILGECAIDTELKILGDDIASKKTYEAKKNKQKAIRSFVDYRTFDSSIQYSTARFFTLSKKLRLELLSMDGAMVIDMAGKIRAIGAILQVRPGSEEGGRLAAAKALSEYGLSFKVSEDGGITGLLDKAIVIRFG